MAAINTMIYMRGNSRDYDVWESKFGAKDWRWDKETPFLTLIFSCKGSLKVPFGQIGSEWEWYHWIGLGEYKDRMVSCF